MAKSRKQKQAAAAKRKLAQAVRQDAHIAQKQAATPTPKVGDFFKIKKLYTGQELGGNGMSYSVPEGTMRFQTGVTSVHLCLGNSQTPAYAYNTGYGAAYIVGKQVFSDADTVKEWVIPVDLIDGGEFTLWLTSKKKPSDELALALITDAMMALPPEMRDALTERLELHLASETATQFKLQYDILKAPSEIGLVLVAA